MKLPEKIIGKNKIRDAAIVNDFKFFDMDFPAIAEKYKLTERRIQQILATNHAFIKRDKEWEKEKRINRLQRRLRESAPTKKDELEILSEIRKEIEGDKPLINLEEHTHVTYVWNTQIDEQDNQDKLQAPRVSTGELEPSGTLQSNN